MLIDARQLLAFRFVRQQAQLQTSAFIAPNKLKSTHQLERAGDRFDRSFYLRKYKLIVPIAL
jgi:hypothetical protein